MSKMNTKINHDLLIQKSENIERIEYSDETVKFITKGVENLRNHIMEKFARFSQSYFLHKVLNSLDDKGVIH